MFILSTGLSISKINALVSIAFHSGGEKKPKDEAIMNQNFERAERTTFDISTKTEDQEKDGGGRKLKD